MKQVDPLKGVKPSVRKIYDCKTCGACCVLHPNRCRASQLRSYVTLLRGDRFPESLVYHDPDEAVTERGPWIKFRRSGRCPFFAGKVGARSSCAIYPLRPRVCAAFAPGSSKCQMLRKEWGLEAPNPLLQENRVNRPHKWEYSKALVEKVGLDREVTVEAVSD